MPYDGMDRVNHYGSETIKSPLKTQLSQQDLIDARDMLYALDEMNGNFTGTLYLNGKSVKVDFDEESHTHVMVV